MGEMMKQREGGIAFAGGAAMLAIATALFRNVVDDAGVFYEGSNGLLRICLTLMVGASIALIVAGKLIGRDGLASTMIAFTGVAILVHASVWAGSTQLHADRLSMGDTAAFVTQIISGVSGFMTGVWLLLFGLSVAALESDYDSDLKVDASRAVGVLVSVIGVFYLLSGFEPRPWTVVAALVVVASAMAWRTRHDADKARRSRQLA